MTNVFKTTDSIQLRRNGQKRVWSCDPSWATGRESGGVLVCGGIPLPLKGSEFDWLYDPNIRCQPCSHMLSSVPWFLCFNSLEVTKHLEGLKWFIYCFKESLLRYRQCESSMFAHVKGRSFCGSVGVWLRSEVNYIAADQPIGGQHALVQQWPCQTPHRRIVWMFALISSCSLMWWSLAFCCFSWVWILHDVICKLFTHALTLDARKVWRMLL